MHRLHIICLVLILAAASPAAAFSPNDPLIQLQWNLGQVGMWGAWDYNPGGSREVRVAILDTGVNYENYQGFLQVSDLRETNFDHEAAWDFVYNDAHPNDGNGHGTHVTGTVAQSTDNHLGVAGLAYGVTIIPVQVFGPDGTADAEHLAKGIDWAVEHGAHIINISAGGGNHPVVEEACWRAYQAGVLVVAAAGNDGLTFLEFPASYDFTLAVGALNYSLGRAYYSNHEYEVVMAPGGQVHSDANQDGFSDGILQQGAYGDFVYMQGTSMATPHVSAVAALILSEALAMGLEIPEPGPQRVEWLRGVITQTTFDLGARGQDREYGYGLLRADNALAFLHGDYEPPQAVSGPAARQLGARALQAAPAADPPAWLQAWDGKFRLSVMPGRRVRPVMP